MWLGNVSSAQWRVGTCDYMATLQGCILGSEAVCLPVQSGEWVGPTGVLGSAVPMSLLLHNPVWGLEAVCWWENGGGGDSVDYLSRVY